MPDVRLIDGTELKKHIESTICYGCQIGHMIPPCGRCYVSMVLRYTDEMPTIDAQPVKRGRWKTVYEHTAIVRIDGIGYETKPKDYVVCSVCGKSSKRADNFCGNCGADMRGDTDETE